MISFRQADLRDKLHSVGEASIIFTLDYDTFADGSKKYFIASDTAGGFEFINASDMFMNEVESFMKTQGFEKTSYGAWKKYLPKTQDTVQYLEGYFSEGGILRRLRESGFFGAAIMDYSNADNFQLTLQISKGNAVAKRADIVDRITKRYIIYNRVWVDANNKRANYSKDVETWSGIYRNIPDTIQVHDGAVDLSDKSKIYSALNTIGYHTVAWKNEATRIIIVLAKDRLNDHRRADLLERVKNLGVKDLVFEKGYMVHQGDGTDLYTFDCRNGGNIGADIVPPIKGALNMEDEILSAEYTKCLNQLWAWGYELKDIEYDNVGQRIILKVKKK